MVDNPAMPVTGASMRSGLLVVMAMCRSYSADRGLNSNFKTLLAAAETDATRSSNLVTFHFSG